MISKPLPPKPYWQINCAIRSCIFRGETVSGAAVIQQVRLAWKKTRLDAPQNIRKKMSGSKTITNTGIAPFRGASSRRKRLGFHTVCSAAVVYSE